MEAPDPKKGWPHMSPLTAGLTATIKEWFSSGEMKTAIEQTAHIAAEKIQKAPKKRTAKKAGGKGGEDSSGGDSATAVAEMPPEELSVPMVESESTTEETF